MLGCVCVFCYNILVIGCCSCYYYCAHILDTLLRDFSPLEDSNDEWADKWLKLVMKMIT